MCSGGPPEYSSTSQCCLVRDRNTILRNSSKLYFHYGPLKGPDLSPNITASTPHYPNPQQHLKAERKCERWIALCTEPRAGVGLAISRLVVHVVGVEGLGEIYKVWSDSFKGKDDLEDTGTDGRVTSRMSRLGNSCSALKQQQTLVAKHLYRYAQNFQWNLSSVRADRYFYRNVET
jgi:hypothetical protein